MTWEEPPARSFGRKAAGRPRLWAERLAPCLERPGEWYKVGVFHQGTAGSLGTLSRHPDWGENYDMPPGKWEFISRVMDQEGVRADDVVKDEKSRRAWLYARYLGPEEDDGRDS